MSLRKNVDMGDMVLLMFGQFVISVILAGINAGIVGWQLMGGAFISQPEVIAWYYLCASIIVFVLYMVISLTWVSVFENEEVN